MKYSILVLISLLFFACKTDPKTADTDVISSDNKETIESEKDSLIYPEEKHFRSLRQITFGGDNAEAYWSFDDKQLVFQSNNKSWGVGCDQMFLMNFEETFMDSIVPPMISTGKGRTTCSYFLPDNKHIIYASTHLGDEKCPETPLRKNGNTFGLFMTPMIFSCLTLKEILSIN